MCDDKIEIILVLGILQKFGTLLSGEVAAH
jgi:hypothetical protein